MQHVREIAPLREQIRRWRKAGDTIAFVPTMGNLHAGHLRLVAEGKARATRVVASIFVNPLQFGANEDLANYPRTPAEDADALLRAGTDLLFLPDEQTIYPYGKEGISLVAVPELGDVLCGASRPGHFQGVSTVVCKLFNMVQPDLACFGQKDYQQLTILRRMVRDLDFPIAIHAVETVREQDGLAMSSRNAYLSVEERVKAPALYQTLAAIVDALRAGERDFATLEQYGIERLLDAGLRPDYLSIRDAEALRPAQTDDDALVVLAAAWLGKARLIDNLLV